MPALQYAGGRNWVDERAEMYYPVSEETMPGLEAAWMRLTRGGGWGAEREITDALKQ